MAAESDAPQDLDLFCEEVREGLYQMWVALKPEDIPFQPSAQLLKDNFIIAHRVKGTAQMFDLPQLAFPAKTLEDLLELMVDQSPEEWARKLPEVRDLLSTLITEFDKVIMDWQLTRGPQERTSDSGPAATSVQEGAHTSSEDQSNHTDTNFPQPDLDDSYLIPDIDPEVMSFFSPEAQEYLDAIEADLLELEKDPTNSGFALHLFRTAHTLKGSSYTVGYTILGDLSHPLEEVLSGVHEGKWPFSAYMADVVLRTVDLMRVLMKRNADQVPDLREKVGTLLGELRQLVDSPTTQPASPAPSPEAAPAASPASETAPVAASVPAPAPAEAKADSKLTDAYLVPDIDAEVISYFAPEAQEYIGVLEAGLLRLESAPQDSEAIDLLFRSAHTLKGSAFTVEFASIGDLTHIMEDFLVEVKEGRMQVGPGVTDVMLRAVDVIRALLRRDANLLPELRQQFPAVLDELQRMNRGEAIESSSKSMQPIAATDKAPAEQAPQQGESKLESQDAGGNVIRVSQERLEHFLNMVGEVVIARGRLDQRLRVLENLSQQVLSYQNRMLESVRSFEEKHMFTSQQTDAAPSAQSEDEGTAGPIQELTDFGSLEFDKYDDFNILARRISEVSADVSESLSQLNLSIRQAREDMSQLQQLTINMRDEISQARMLPVGTPFVRFRRAVREMARATGKEVTLVTSGEQTEVDTGVVERLVDPLVHLVRNSVYHGIETAQVRVANGKPAVGTVYLHAAHRGNSVIIEVEDDGAGIDVEKIKAKAVKLGLLRQDAAQALSQTEAINLIFLPNFSTADSVGDQAGRGVGMDVVKRVIESIGGRIAVETVKGTGTKFTLELPLTLLISTALLVRVGEDRFAIPLPTVQEVVISRPGEIQDLGGKGIIQVGEEGIHVEPLGKLLSGIGNTPDDVAPVVIARTPAGPLGLIVDELLGRQEIVIKSLGDLTPLKNSAFGGATIDPEGRVILVLDVSRLAETGSDGLQVVVRENASASEDSSMDVDDAGRKKPVESNSILLMDDSLSIRKFVGRMLQSAGYTVETAVDGEEGLRKVWEGHYKLIITDLEMPKMNGFEVIQALRARPQTQTVPVVVMTTRAGDKHRQMALNLGATAYLTKPITENALHQEVRRWISQPVAGRQS